VQGSGLPRSATSESDWLFTNRRRRRRAEELFSHRYNWKKTCRQGSSDLKLKHCIMPVIYGPGLRDRDPAQSDSVGDSDSESLRRPHGPGPTPGPPAGPGRRLPPLRPVAFEIRMWR
jgi:hypothetical protein